MKKKFLFFFLLFPFVLLAQMPSLESLRNDYSKLNSDSTACSKVYAKISKVNTTDNILLAYKGAISTCMANHKHNKQEKITLFNEGKKLLEQSIKTDSANVELRFLRFTVQTNCPKALGYYKQIDTDKKYIIAHLGSVKSVSQKSKMTDYLLGTKYLTETEKQNIKN